MSQIVCKDFKKHTNTKTTLCQRGIIKLSVRILIYFFCRCCLSFAAFRLLFSVTVVSAPLTVFQMFEDWFSSSEADASGLSSVSPPELGSDFSSGLSHGSGLGSGSDFDSAWGSGEVLQPCLLGVKSSKQ